MLATILKSKSALNVTFAIIETFTHVRSLKRELLDLHKETDSKKQMTKMQHFGKVLSDIVMPDLETSETESTLELNFFIGKIKHTVRRLKKQSQITHQKRMNDEQLRNIKSLKKSPLLSKSSKGRENNYNSSMRKIVVAADSFKGSLSSAEVAEAVALGVREVFPECEVVCLDVADGGEGTMKALLKALGGVAVECEAHDPLMRPLRAEYGISADGGTAIIDMAAASGLTLLREDERNPMLTTTFGTGEMVAHALRSGCRRVIIGLGGSATNDGGTGMLTALGFRFVDAGGTPLPGTGGSLLHIASVDASGVLPQLAGTAFTAACDVVNPLCGPDGAAYVYAPQKGAGAAMAETLDSGLRNFGTVTERFCGRNITDVRGAGAAGGMGAGMLAYLNAELVPGAELLLDAMRFDEITAGADLVITGEGRIDEQTLMGKLPVRVLRRASASGIPVVALGGQVTIGRNPGFAKMLSVSPAGCPPETAMLPEVAFSNVRNAVAELLWNAEDISYFAADSFTADIPGA